MAQSLSMKVAPATKTPAAAVNALDALSPVFAPFAARWAAEADRRRSLRTPANLKALMEAQRANTSARSTAAQARAQRQAARKSNANPLSTARRAARTADKAARRHRAEARAKLRTAQRSYPKTLRRLAVEAHALHAVPSTVATYALSTAQDWTVWPASVSAALVALNAGALWLGRRSVSAQVADDGMSAEERRLVERLDPSYWVQHAEERGLAGTVTTPAQVTESGLVSHVRLDDKWTPKAFKAKAEEIRALLGARTDLRMEIKAGSHGDRARIVLRTRSAADGIDLSGWAPGAPWGVDTVTGDLVHVPLGHRMLVAGASGSGKSWSTRAILGEASEYPDHRLVIFDRKRVEALNWQHRARTAVEPEDMLALSDELVAEMHERLDLIPRGKDVIAISPDRPRITVFVDEGAELIAVAEAKAEKKGDPPRFARLLENLRTVARMGRAAEIILIWATQKPTMTGPGYGIDSQIAAQITVRAALYLSTATESRTVFGDDAIEKGWHAHELPEKGHALLRVGAKGSAHPIRTRACSPSDVIALPDRPVWSRGEAAQSSPDRPALTLVKGTEAQPQAAPATNRERVAQAVAAGARTPRDVVDATGLNKGTISREIKALVSAGALVRHEDGTLTATGMEAAS